MKFPHHSRPALYWEWEINNDCIHDTDTHLSSRQMRYFTFTKYAIEMRRFRIQRELQHQPMDYNKYKFISTISAVHSVGVEWEHSCLKCSYARNNVQVKNLQGFQKDTNSGSRNKQLHVYLTHNAKYDHFHLQSFIAETSFLAGTNRQHFQGF